MIAEKKAVPEFLVEPEMQFKPPRIDIPKLVQASEGNIVTFEEEGIFWKVNFDRFHQDIR